MSYKNLDIYKRSYAIALEIHKQSANFPKEEKFGLISQIRRSSRSIPANIAEGAGRQSTSDADFKRFLAMALGSCNETSVWIDFCVDLNLVDTETASSYQKEYLELEKMISSFIKTVDQRIKA